MNYVDLLIYVNGIILLIVGFFLKKNIDENKETKNIVYDNKQKISILEIDYLNKVGALNERFDALNKSIDKLTEKIDNLYYKI